MIEARQKYKSAAVKPTDKKQQLKKNNAVKSRQEIAQHKPELSENNTSLPLINTSTTSFISSFMRKPSLKAKENSVKGKLERLQQRPQQKHQLKKLELDRNKHG